MLTSRQYNSTAVEFPIRYDLMKTNTMSYNENLHAHACAHTINVLIACEESQAECRAFREMGFNAFSCDIQPCRKTGNPDWHILGDVTPYLGGQTTFTTQSEKECTVDHWHLIIAHPPCTYLCKVSSVHMRINGEIQPQRYEAMKKARSFFFRCLNAKADFVAVENPLPMALAQLPKPSCYLQPSWFGVKYTKKTLYWLRNLPPVMCECEYPNPKQFIRSSRGKYRSRTFPQVAEALAKQWGTYILDELTNHQSVTK